MSATVETPVVETPAIINPVLPDNFSAENFRAEMEKAAPKPVEASEPEGPAETPPAKEKAAGEPPASKDGDIPQELLDGIPAKEKEADPTIAEIDAMVLPKGAKAEQVASFKTLKEKAKAEITAKLARIAELETKTSAGASKADTEAAEARVKAAEAKAKELEQTVERLAYTESPRFKAFIADETAALDGAKAYLNGSEISPDVIELAARTVGPNRLRLLREAGMESDIISAIAPYLAQYDTVQRNKAASLENWKTEATQHQAAEQERVKQAQAHKAAQEDQVWTSVATKAAAELLPLRKSEGNTAWNEQGEAIAARAKLKYNGDGVALEDLAHTILKGEAYDVLDKAFQSLRDTNKSLAAENAKLKAAKPAGPISSGADGAVPVNATPVERSKATFNQELARVQTG